MRWSVCFFGHASNIRYFNWAHRRLVAHWIKNDGVLNARLGRAIEAPNDAK